MPWLEKSNGVSLMPKSEESFEFWFKKPVRVQARQMKEGFLVETLEGQMIGGKGDYLVIGVEGKHYPVKREIFEKTYSKESSVPVSVLGKAFGGVGVKGIDWDKACEYIYRDFRDLERISKKRGEKP